MIYSCLNKLGQKIHLAQDGVTFCGLDASDWHYSLPFDKETDCQRCARAAARERDMFDMSEYQAELLRGNA